MFKIMKLPNGCDNSNEVVNIDSTLFTQQLKTKWDEIHSESDVFRYKITNLRERIIDNKYIVLLNTERGSNRRAPEHIDNIRQPFDVNKFNFNKASPKEIIFKFNDSGGADIHALLVNISPISRYHTLLCPSVNKNLPQIVTEENLKLALEIKFLARERDLRIGFNSLCAFASVNHLHYHLLFEKNTLHVETAKTVHLRGPVHIIEDYPVPAFCFQVTQESMHQATRDIYQLIDHLLFKSIAHNIFVTGGDSVVPGSQSCDVVRVLVTPRVSSAGIKQLTSFNVAVCELSGWFPVFNPEHFDDLNALDLENELEKWKLPYFEDLCNEIKAIYKDDGQIVSTHQQE